MDDELPYIPDHLLVKLPRLSDRDAVAFLAFIQKLAYEIDSHYFGQAYRFNSRRFDRHDRPDDSIGQPEPFSLDCDPPF
jgi:hypothetical protein